MVELLTRYKSQLPTCVIHCFTGTKEQAITYLSLGCYIGLTGYLWKDKSEDGVRKILQDNVIPLDRLLVETDAPFMYPNTRASKLPQHVKDAMTDRYHFHYHFQIVFEMLSDICTGLPCFYKDTAHFNATNLAPCPWQSRWLPPTSARPPKKLPWPPLLTHSKCLDCQLELCDHKDFFCIFEKKIIGVTFAKYRWQDSFTLGCFPQLHYFHGWHRPLQRLPSLH